MGFMNWANLGRGITGLQKPAGLPSWANQQLQAVGTGRPMPAGGGRVFNPDMSVIANFVGVTGKNPNNTEPTMSLSEVEVAMQAVVDPYARADFYLSAGPDGMGVEEGFITFTALPEIGRAHV